MHVIGGPLGTGSCHLNADVVDARLSQQGSAEDLQEVLGTDGSNVGYVDGEMESTTTKARIYIPRATE